MLYRLDGFYTPKMVYTPTIPYGFQTINGDEDSKTPRVCVSDSIDGAIAALGYDCSGNNYVVYTPVNPKIKTYKPTKKQVPDAYLTGEVWIKKPVEMNPIGYITTGSYKDRVVLGKVKFGKKEYEVYTFPYTFIPATTKHKKK